MIILKVCSCSGSAAVVCEGEEIKRKTDRSYSDGFVVLLPQVPHPLRPLPLVEVHPTFPRQDVALIQRR